MSTIRNPLLKEVADGSMAFFREARNGTANVEQAKVGSSFAGRVISAVNTDLKERLAQGRLNEIEGGGAVAAT